MSLKVKLLIFFGLVNVSQNSIFAGIKEEKSSVENNNEGGKSSLVFVFDTTGSMHNDLKQLREGAEMILNTALEESNIISDFVFVPFHDPAVGPVTVTSDKEVFKNALELVNVYGGGDCPEKSLGGIQLALNVSEPKSFIYVFTDATAGDHRLVGKVLDAVQRKQSQVVFVLTGHCNDLEKPTYKVYQQIAAASSGQVFNLNKTSVHKVLEFVKSSIKGRMVNLGSSVNPAGYNFTQKIPVDSTLGEVTVSVSGAKPQITVVNPSGEQLTGPPKLITTLDLSEIMVVKVMQPEPGNWSITVGSEEEYSLKVVGLSNLTFSHGFSVQPPNTMAETSYRPLEGTYNHMMISLSQSDAPVQIDYAEILSLGGKTIFEMPLTEVEENSKIYTAKAFIPPDDFFYIAINGKDENGHDLRRIGTTAVQVKLPDVPYLTAPRKVEVNSHSRVVLKCKVESLVPVTAMWTKGTAIIQKRVSSLQTTTVEYIIEDMTEEDVGIYKCNARNVAGISRAATEVVLLVDPPQVIMEPTNLTLEIGDDANISCTVFSEALLFKFQFISHNNESHEVIDLAVEPSIDGMYTYNITVQDATESDAGNYTCGAANRGGSSNRSTTVYVKSKPTAQILGAHEFSAKLHDVVTLYCMVQNSNAIFWVNNGTRRKEINLAGNHSVTDFVSVNVTDDANWTCKAVRGSLEASDSVQISVLLKPEVTILGSNNVTVLNGTSLEIFCEVTAKPEPRILWYRGNEEKFINHTTTALDSKTYRSTIQLNSSVEDIHGTYFCVGENSLGIHEDTATIHVRRKMHLLHGFNDTSVQLYDQTELNCDVDVYPPPRITWHHNNTELVIKSNVHVSGDSKIVSISRVDFDDLGTYSCEVDNGFEKMEVNGTLSVHGLDAPVLFKDQPLKRIVKQGESTIITCRILMGSPKPTIKWMYKSKESSNFTTLHNMTSEDTMELMINDVTIEQAGSYRCVAENVVGRDEYNMELIIYYPPQFKTDVVNQKPIQIEAGDTVTFNCNAVGIPPPIVLWNKDGQPMVYGKNSHLTNSSLVIDNVTEYDSGLFTCIARSPMGSVEKNFTLFVYVAPKILSPTTNIEQEILEGQLVELPCEAKGVPSPEVLWLHNEEVVTDGRKYIDEFGIRFVANLTDFGNYTCVVKNQYGNTSLSYSLFIWVPPYIQPPLETAANVLTGEDATLECDVVGFPIPSIEWEFRGEILKENTTNLSFNDFGNLYLTNTSSEYEGAYACIAENTAGVAKKYIYLNINEPPKILEDNYTGPYLVTNMDSAVNIACRVIGKPIPYVLWMRDDFYIDKDVRFDIHTDGTLTINSPNEDVSGNYTCIAKNSVGATNKTVEVMVYSLPTQMQSEASHPVVTVMEHTNANVTCPTRASHTDTVKWYKDATLISMGDLEILNISRADQATYACVVTNAVGSAYSAIRLSVEWPPKFLSENSNRIIDSGKDSIVNVEHTMSIPSTVANFDSTPNSVNDMDKRGDNIEKYTEISTISSNIKVVYDDNFNIEIVKNDNHKEAQTNSTKIFDVNGTNNVVNITENLKGFIKDANSRNKHFVKEINKFEVLRGDDAYLDCSVDAKPIAKTKWLFNSKPIVFENKEHLRLLNIQRHNAGIYKCVVSNAHGTIQKDFHLKVLEPPFISEFDVLDVLLMEGMNATLECNAKGVPEPSLHWTFKNSNWIVENSSLTATNISSAAEGLYQCDARNAAGKTHIVYRVDIVSGAKVEEVIAYRGGEGSSVNKSLEVEVGSHIRVACKATGKPAPTIQWLRNGKVMSENQLDLDYADLMIDGLATSHAGSYSCVAANQGGSDERKLRLEVLEPPKIFRNLIESENSSGSTVTLEVLSGQAYYLHCHANGNPAPELYWFRDGLPLMLFDDTMISTEFGEVIEVKRAMEEQSGNYTCVARNKAGNNSLVYLVDVLTPPRQPKESTRLVNIRFGKKLTLTCPVEGTPTPYVMWNKLPYTEIENTSRLLLVNDNVTLIINRTQVSDSGNYSCIMTNKVGTTEMVFAVTIEKPPSIAGHAGSESHDVTLASSIVLKCEADGHPLPKISWLKDTQRLSDSLSNINRVLGNSLLVMWRVTPRDAGQYICVVENVAGSAYRRYDVRVKVPGKWTSWSQWSYCNVTCGLGHQQRSRSCQYIDENNVTIDKSSKSNKLLIDESACKGPSNETRKCHMPPCEESESWSTWSRWSACSASCGSGTQARTRACRGDCGDGGDNVQIRKCLNLPKCTTFQDNTGEDVLDGTDELIENNGYAPEAVFEMQPEIVSSHFSPHVEEFYLATGSDSKNSRVFYDVNVTSNLDGSDAGPCKAGFRHDIRNGSCDDIDECLIENNQCHSTQVCVNVKGAYQCTCSPGFLSLGAGQRCMDINECSQEISGCEHACVNVVGGYVCACPAHMRLHEDKHHCYAVNSLASLRRPPHFYEDLDTSHYLTTSVEHPARYKHMSN